MRHIKARQLQFLLNAADFSAHVKTQLRIKVAQRFVHQKNGRAQHQNACQRHTLLLTPGQLIGVTVFGFGQSHHFQPFAHLASQFVPGDVADPQSVGHVVENRHVRKKGVVLKNEPHVALVGRHGRHVFAVHQNSAARRGFKPGDHSKGRCLTAARRP